MGNLNHIENSTDGLKNRILKVSSTFSVPSKTSSKEAWMAFEKLASNAGPGGKEIRFNSGYALKIAATLLIVVVASFTLYTFQEVEIRTGYAEIETITLPDQSTVVLNAGSSLKYNALAFHFTRKLNFNGEGFFQVQKGSTFEVISDQGGTKVLGTKFNVVARKNRYEVSCVEGKVRVSTKVSSVMLTAGLRTTSLDQKLNDPIQFKEEVGAWQQGEFYFEATPLQGVLNTLELQYNVKIQFIGDSTRVYTGYFTNQNLDEALKLVCLPLKLDYEIVNKTEIKISTKK